MKGILGATSVAAAVQYASSVQLQAVSARDSDSPIAMVVTLLGEMKAKIESDGKAEQADYDKYACWCEETLARKSGDITSGKEQIEELDTLIKKLKAEIATHTSEIAETKNLIAANVASRKEATEMRENQKESYVAEKTESEQCIGALEAAIKVLSGAGTGKTGFLGTLQQTQVISAAAGMRTVLKREVAAHTVSDSDLDVLRRFVDKPEDFIGGSSSSESALQVSNNPFGDYAPQSTQIQGILKGMYDTFVGDLEKANADESDAQKSFEALMATKMAEHATLTATLQKHEVDEAQKGKSVAESTQLRDDTTAQVAADEKFFAESKDACKSKAADWSSRTRLRTEELNGIATAVSILSSPEAVGTFENATSTFLQTGSISTHAHEKVNQARDEAWQKLKVLSRKYGSIAMAEIATNVKMGGHFDKVIASIDKLIELLRKEEQEDIAHRDRCQGSQNKNANDMEDLAHSMDMSEKAIERMQDKETELREKVSTLEGEINATKTDLNTALDMRNADYAAFIQALKDDKNAVALIEQAIGALMKFYKNNDLKLGFAQKSKKQEPEYTQDPDKAPETSWKSGSYGGKSSESGGIVAILGMIKEDLEKEMKTGKEEDNAAQKEYLGQKSALEGVLASQEATKVATEKELADLLAAIEARKEDKAQADSDLSSQKELEGSIATDCSWVETHFDSRREKRQAEMQGLVDAKNYLAGVESGDEV